MAPKGSHIVISVSVRSSVIDFFFLTDSSLCSLLLQNHSINFSNTDTNLPREHVDLQHIVHFDLHPSMTAGQGYEILQFY